MTPAEVEQLAWKVGDKVADRLETRIDERIRLHQAECPVKANVEATLNQAKGAARIGKAVWVLGVSFAAAVGFVVDKFWAWAIK